jgi:hypothetical protein
MVPSRDKKDHPAVMLAHEHGQGDETRFFCLTGIAVAADGSLLVVDCHDYRLRRVSLDGTVSTVGGAPAGEEQV